MEKLKILWLKLQRLIKGESVKMDASVPIWKKRVTVKQNKDFISIRAYSGYAYSCMVDYSAKEFLLVPDISDEKLGADVLESLNSSCSLSLEEDNYLSANLQSSYEVWVEKIKKLYGYKTRKAMFRWMKSCSVELDGDTLIISPSYHERIEAWGDGNGVITEADDVKISADSSPEEIGAALRLAFSRCKSKTF